MDENEKIAWNSIGNKTPRYKNLLVYLTIFAVVVVNVFDLLTIKRYGFIQIANPLNILIALLITGLFALKKINISVTYSLITYSALLNLVLCHWFQISFFENLPAQFLRSSLLYILLSSVFIFTGNKKHIIIAGLLMLLFHVVAVIISKNAYLEKNIILFVFIIIIYFSTTYFLAYKFEQDESLKADLHTQILQSNEDLLAKADYLSKVNDLLEFQRKQIEGQANELKELIKQRDVFYAIISHDLKNPLGAIMGISELLNEKIQTTGDIKMIKYTNAIHKSSHQVYNLLINLLDWTRIQTNKMVLMPEILNFKEIVDTQVELITPMADAKKIKLIINQTLESLQIFADKNMMCTVIRNFISNAVKFTPIDGSITITYRKTEDSLIFSVIDTGIGIKKENLAKLFKADERFQRMGTNKETGTGLGLILCNEFIHKHQGKIEVQSELNVGSEFSFYIPIISRN